MTPHSACVQAAGFENWNYTVENVDGSLQVRHLGIQLNKEK